MTRQPYDYSTRRGIHPISWEDFHGLCKGLVSAVAPFCPEIILAVGRGGFYPGTLIAHMLRAEIYPVRLSRRVNDVVRYERPQWLVRPPDAVRDRRVLVVDEISSTGETIALVRSEAERLGAAEIRSAVLYAHTWGTATPDYIGLITDALILNPWDREILQDGQFVVHPEYAAALKQQGVEPDPSLLIGAAVAPIAKQPGS
jgi:hypoxanthine phosphoribosyltransferase